MQHLFSLLFLALLCVQAKSQEMNIAMVSIPVENPSEAFAYYTDTLGFDKVMHVPEQQLAIVQSSLQENGPMLLLEPIMPAGLEFAKKYKEELYEKGIPAMSFGTNDIQKTAKALKDKGVVFKTDPVKTDFGYQAVFDDAQGNYIQLIQMD
jgi:predicted enzyme related to lactoylglutathione lyase